MDAGFYWVRVTYAVCDGGGIISEPWGEPEVARFDGYNRWYLTDVSGPLSDQEEVKVLSPLLEAPK